MRKSRKGGGSTSLCSLESLPPVTLPTLFRAAGAVRGSRLALAVERPVPPKDAKGKAPSLPQEHCGRERCWRLFCIVLYCVVLYCRRQHRIGIACVAALGLDGVVLGLRVLWLWA